MRYRILPLVLLAGLLAVAGCDGVADLNVENPNAPDAERAIADPSDLQSVLAGGYTSFWDGTYEAPGYYGFPHFDGWGDAMTTTNAFAGFWTMAVDEPRPRFQNTLSFSDLGIVGEPWSNLNAAISSANDVIRQIQVNDFEVVIDGSDRTQVTLAAAYFLRGLAYGHLANLFNQAYVTTEEFNAEDDLADLPFSEYDAVLTQATDDLAQARSIAEGSSFTVPNSLTLPFSTTLTADRLVRMINTFEARFIVSNPRSPSENDAINWDEVRTLTQNGIQEDVVLTMDGNTWFSNYWYVSGLYWYWRVDNRILNMMDPDYPIKYPADQAGSPLPPAESDDARLCPTSGDNPVFDGITFFEGDAIEIARSEEFDNCYFAYDTDQSFFRVARGPTLQSNYWYVRDYVDQQWNFQPFGAGPGPVLLAEENRLMQAEAEMRASGGSKGTAIELINNGSRVNAGQLAPLPATASDEEVLTTIYYERDIELYRTGIGLSWFDLRRRGQLQAGTPLHLPVPATELQTVGQELYTFGGVGSAGQPGTASGDNAWCDQGDLSCDGPFGVPDGTIPGGNLTKSNAGSVGGNPMMPPRR